MTLLIRDNQKQSRAAYKKAWRSANLDRERAKERARESNRDPGLHRDRDLKRKYGIEGRAHWEAIFDAQGRKCAACAATDPGSATSWHVDHNHNNPEPNYRAILCSPCNLAIGKAKECSSRLRACASYLDEHAGR